MGRYIRKLMRRMLLISFASFTVLLGTGGGIGSVTPFLQQHQLCSLFVAHAKYSHELTQSATHSIRPGMNLEQINRIESGDMDIEDIQSSSIFDTSTSTSNYEQAKKKNQQQRSSKSSSSSKVAYGDEDDDDYDEFDDESVALQRSMMNDGLGTGIDEREKMIAQKLESMRTERYAGDKGFKTRGLTAIVAAGFFIPTYGSLIVREYVRRQREERYVQKGLEILEAQKAEYFNVTTSKTNDSDLQDELKDMKNKNETKTDDEDDGDDDEGEDENDDQGTGRSSSQPRRPKGGGDNGGGGGNDDKDGGSSSGGGGPRSEGGDDTPPSQEELDRLNRMFNKS